MMESVPHPGLGRWLSLCLWTTPAAGVSGLTVDNRLTLTVTLSSKEPVSGVSINTGGVRMKKLVLNSAWCVNMMWSSSCTCCSFH